MPSVRKIHSLHASTHVNRLKKEALLTQSQGCNTDHPDLNNVLQRVTLFRAGSLAEQSVPLMQPTCSPRDLCVDAQRTPNDSIQGYVPRIYGQTVHSLDLRVAGGGDPSSRST